MSFTFTLRLWEWNRSGRDADRDEFLRIAWCSESSPRQIWIFGKGIGPAHCLRRHWARDWTPAVFGFLLQPFPEAGWPLRCLLLAHLPRAPPHGHWFVHLGGPDWIAAKGFPEYDLFHRLQSRSWCPFFFIEVLFDQNRITLPEFLGLTFLRDLEICQPR